MTIYRDQRRAEQVLSTTGTDAPAVSADAARLAHPVTPVPDMIAGATYRKETPAGTVRVTVNSADGQPFEVFLLLGRAGSEVQSFAEALGRTISLCLRLEGRVPPTERLQLIADQLQGIGGAQQIGVGPERVLSVADGIGQILARHASGQPVSDGPSAPLVVDPSSATIIGDLCPACGAASVVMQEGCAHCVTPDCTGWSRC